MKIYTRKGDDGTTGLLGGPRRGKDDARVAAYGDVDELSSALGVARAGCADAELVVVLARLQNELFTLGGQLATPDPSRGPKGMPAIGPEHVAAMEQEIDHFDAELEPLREFVLPGGAPLAAQLHVARTVCRRAERAVVALGRHEPLPALCLEYLNRLSDLLFTLARVANRRAGAAEPKWEKTR